MGRFFPGALFIAAALLATLVAGVLFIRGHQTFPWWLSPSAQPQGTLYLTLTPTAKTTSGIYTLSLADHVLHPVLVPLRGSAEMPRVTPHGILFVTDHIGKRYLTTPQLALLSGTTTTRLTDTPSLSKRDPLFVPAWAHYVYSGQDADALGTDPESFTTYVFDSATDKGLRLSAGVLPAVVPNVAGVALLRDDGIYLATAASAQKVWTILNGAATLDDQFAISPQGDRIAWAVPEEGKLYVMHVSSWQPFSGQLERVVDTEAQWPIFSQDGNFIAYVQSSGTSQSIALLDQKSATATRIFDLSPYAAGTTAITDWQ